MTGTTPNPIQQPLAELPSRTWDVIIAGAGPAGSICARALAERGHGVLLLDRERFPRHKVCGDLLIADSLALLRRVGLYDRIDGLAHYSDAITVFSPGGHRFDVPGEFLTLKRRRLDHELAAGAVEAGAAFTQAEVTDLAPPASDDRPVTVAISDSEHPLQARIAVLATGAVVDTAARVGLVHDPHPSAVAVRFYVTSHGHVPHTLIAYDRSILPGYGWIVPLGPTDTGEFVYNVGCGTSYRFVRDGRHHLKRTLMTFLQQFQPARRVMAQSTHRSRIAGASLRCGLPDIDRAAGSSRLLVGESAGTTYPFTGEGIGKAMETGLIAAECIADALAAGDPARLGQYRERLRNLRPRYDGYVTAEKWLGHRRLNDFVAWRITRSPDLRDMVGQFMAETGDPAALFKIGSLLKSFWK